jgi:hypothetical protein
VNGGLSSFFHEARITAFSHFSDTKENANKTGMLIANIGSQASLRGAKKVITPIIVNSILTKSCMK